MAGLSTVDGSEMLRGDVGSRAGAAFLLTAKAPITREWRREDGWAVEIREGSRYVVANGGSASHYREVWTTAHEVAQEALDYWSLRGLRDLATESPFGNHIAFWDSASGSVLRIAGRERSELACEPRPRFATQRARLSCLRLLLSSGTRACGSIADRSSPMTRSRRRASSGWRSRTFSMTRSQSRPKGSARHTGSSEP